MAEIQFEILKDSPEMVDLKNNLQDCIGTEHYHSDSMTGLHVTDGIMILREKGHCFWLVSDILIAAGMKFNCVPFQIWILSVSEDKVELTMREDTDRPVLYYKEYSVTDFPKGIFKLYLINGILMLPSEY